MTIKEVLQRIDELIEYYGEERWGGGAEAAYDEGAYDVLCRLRNEIKKGVSEE